MSETRWVRNTMAHSTKYLTREDLDAAAKKDPVCLLCTAHAVSAEGIELSSPVVTTDVDTVNALLARCPVFREDVANGGLEVLTEKPEEAKDSGETIADLKTQNTELQNKLTVLENASGGSSELTEALKQIAELKAANAALTAAAAAADKTTDTTAEGAATDTSAADSTTDTESAAV